MKKLFCILSLFAAFAFMALPAMAMACDDPPQEPTCPDLVEVTNTVEVTTDAECTWEIEKTVEEVTPESTPESTALSLDMTEGESAEVEYTIEVDKECPETADYTFTGQVDVTNNIPIWFDVYVEDVNVDVSGEDAANPGTWNVIGSVVAYADEVSGDDVINPGQTKSYPYSETYTLTYGAYSNFQTTATVGSYILIWDGYFWDWKIPVVDTDDSDVEPAPEASNQEITITDVETINPNNGGVTYAITTGPNPLPDDPPVIVSGTTTMSWTLTDDATISYIKTITANTAGGYTLANDVTRDNECEPEAGTDVYITVSTPPPVTVGGGPAPTPILAIAGLTTEVKGRSKAAGLQVAGLTELPFTGFNLINNLLLGGGLSLAGISALVASIRRRR